MHSLLYYTQKSLCLLAIIPIFLFFTVRNSMHEQFRFEYRKNPIPFGLTSGCLDH